MSTRTAWILLGLVVVGALTTGTDDLLSKIAVVVASAALLFWLVRISSPGQRLVAGEKDLKDGRANKAVTRLGKVVSLLEARGGRKTARPADREMLSRASLALAEAYLLQNSRGSAASQFKKARQYGAALPPQAVRLVAEIHAEKNDGTDEALDAYFASVALRTDAGASSEKLNTVLEGLCQVSETMNSAARKRAIELNKRAISGNAKLEWAHYYLGLAHLLEGHVSAAAESLTTARSLKPERALTHYWLGVCRLQQADPDLAGAIELMDRFLVFPSTNAKTLKRQGNAAFEIGKRLAATFGGFKTTQDCSGGTAHETLARVIHYLETAAHRQPENGEYQFYLGRLYALNGDSTRSVAALETAEELSPGEKLYAYELGVQCGKAALLDKAVSALQRAISADPNYTEAHFLLASLSSQIGDWAAVETHCRTLLKLGREDSSILLWLIAALYELNDCEAVIHEYELRLHGSARPELVYPVGRSYARIGRLDKAILLYEALPEDPRAHYYLGCAYAHTGRYGEAISCFDQVIASDATYGLRAYVQRGHTQLAKGDPAGAEQDYQTVLEREPANREVLYAMGVLLAEREDFEGARAFFSRITSPDPRARLAMAILAERQGDMTHAIEAYEALLGDPGLGSIAAVRAGILHCRQGKYETALQRLESSGSEADAVLFYRGTALLFCGQVEQGVAVWRQLQERDPDDERLDLNLCRASYMLGAQQVANKDYDAAIVAWEKYLARFPSDEKVSKDVGALHFRIAIAALRSGEAPGLSDAAVQLEKALDYDSQNKLYQFCAALCNLHRGQLDQCAARLVRLAASEGGDLRALYHLGLCRLRQGKTEEALKIFGDVAPSADSVGYSRYAAWALANEHVRTGRKDHAIEVLAGAL